METLYNTIIIIVPFTQSISSDRWFTRVDDNLLVRLTAKNKLVAYGFYINNQYKSLTDGPKLIDTQGIDLADKVTVDKEPLIIDLKSKLLPKLTPLWTLGPTFFLDEDNRFVLERLPSGQMALHGQWNGTAPCRYSDDDIKKARKLGYFIINDGPELISQETEDDSDFSVKPFPQLGEDYYQDMESTLIVKMVQTATVVGNWDGTQLTPIPEELKARAKFLGLPSEGEK